MILEIYNDDILIRAIRVVTDSIQDCVQVADELLGKDNWNRISIQRSFLLQK